MVVRAAVGSGRTGGGDRRRGRGCDDAAAAPVRTGIRRGSDDLCGR